MKSMELFLNHKVYFHTDVMKRVGFPFCASIPTDLTSKRWRMLRWPTFVGLEYKAISCYLVASKSFLVVFNYHRHGGDLILDLQDCQMGIVTESSPHGSDRHVTASYFLKGQMLKATETSLTQNGNGRQTSVLFHLLPLRVVRVLESFAHHDIPRVQGRCRLEEQDMGFLLSNGSMFDDPGH